MTIVFRLPAEAAKARRSPATENPPAVLKKRKRRQLGLVADAEEQLVVLPELVGHQHQVARIDEQVGKDAQGMGHAGGDRPASKSSSWPGWDSSRTSSSRHFFRRSGRPVAGA